MDRVQQYAKHVAGVSCVCHDWPMAGHSAGTPAEQGPGPRGAGRPPVSSRSAIEDAAGELFLENSYSGTSIEQIASRAGVSRATFFNYFGAKSDLLWGDVDLLVDAVADQLSALPADVAPMEGVRRALVAAAELVGSDRIPLAATQGQVMGAREELLASGFLRFARLASRVYDHLLVGSGGRDGGFARAAAYAVVGAVAAAAAEWAGAGTSRGALPARIDAAIAPVCDGFARSFRPT